MTFKEGLQQVEQAYQKMVEAQTLITDAVVNGFLFTWQWWLGLSLAVIPWAIWFVFRKKESSDRLLYTGFTVMILSSVVDIVAISLGLWTYPMKVFPSTNVFFPFQFSLVPVTVMFFLQFKQEVNFWVKAVAFSDLGALVMPFFGMIDFYNAKGWPSIYDFFIFLSIYSVAHWFSKIKNFESLSSNQGQSEQERTLPTIRWRRKEKGR